LFHYSDTYVHITSAAITELHELHFEVLPHIPDSPDLYPSDFFLFPDMKKWLTGKRF
ncbi:Histone-lysine N-methyltransferase SETMAR, partial [Harpegnathos saltator]